jgi:hypothetical protein
MDNWTIAVEAGILFAAGITGMWLFFKRGVKKASRRFIWKSVPDFPSEFSWHTHSSIHESLSELRIQTDSGRTQVVQFHNGGEFLDGISMKKLSLTHESLARGVSSEMPSKQEIPISMCIPIMCLLRNDEPKIHVTEQLEESWNKNYYQTTNTISFALLPLRIKNNIVGFVMCQWCSWDKTDSIDEDSVSRELQDSRALIEVQLRQQLDENQLK